mgnify:CR=1 FL=1
MVHIKIHQYHKIDLFMYVVVVRITHSKQSVKGKAREIQGKGSARSAIAGNKQQQQQHRHYPQYKRTDPFEWKVR